MPLRLRVPRILRLKPWIGRNKVAKNLPANAFELALSAAELCRSQSILVTEPSLRNAIAELARKRKVSIEALPHLEISDDLVRRLQLLNLYAKQRTPEMRKIHGRVKKEDLKACLSFLEKFKEDGFAFLAGTKYESSIGIIAIDPNGNTFGTIKLNFLGKKRKVLCIDAIQGSRGRTMALWKTNTGQIPWPNLLVQHAIETARRAGFSEVRLLKPQANPWCKDYYNKKNTKVTVSMERLYYSVAKKEGFRKAKGKFFVLYLT
ncbi:MAG: hypothetical protein QXK06_04250 [Candidatus Diapherotrites archaeon]